MFVCLKKHKKQRVYIQNSRQLQRHAALVISRYSRSSWGGGKTIYGGDHKSWLLINPTGNMLTPHYSGPLIKEHGVGEQICEKVELQRVRVLYEGWALSLFVEEN